MEETKKTYKGFKLFILIFALLAVVFFKEDNQQKFIKFLNDLKSKDIDLQLNKQYKGSNLNYFDETLIKWEDNNLTFLNNDGSAKWIKEFDFIEPEIVYSDKIIYVLDKSLGDIYLLDSNGDTISKIQLKMPIFSIKESNNNLLIHIKDETTESLKIIYKGENNLDELIKVNENILTYSLNSDSTKYVYSSLKLTNSDIVSKMAINSIEGKEEYSVEIHNEIIISTEFIKDKLMILTDSTLNIADNGEIKWSKEYPLIKDVFISNNEIYLLYGDNIEVIDLDGETKSKTTFGVEYKRIASVGDFIVLYGNSDLIVLQNANEVLRYKAEEDIIKIVGNNNQIILQYTDKIQVLKFIKKASKEAL